MPTGRLFSGSPLPPRHKRSPPPVPNSGWGFSSHPTTFRRQRYLATSSPRAPTCLPVGQPAGADRPPPPPPNAASLMKSTFEQEASKERGALVKLYVPGSQADHSNDVLLPPEIRWS